MNKKLIYLDELSEVTSAMIKAGKKRIKKRPPVFRPLATPDQEHFYQFLKDVTL